MKIIHPLYKIVCVSVILALGIYLLLLSVGVAVPSLTEAAAAHYGTDQDCQWVRETQRKCIGGMEYERVVETLWCFGRIPGDGNYWGWHCGHGTRIIVDWYRTGRYCPSGPEPVTSPH